MPDIADQLRRLVHDEVSLDLLLVCANKPVNYYNLSNFSLNDLWTISKAFTEARNHDQQTITEAIEKLQEAIGSGGVPELMRFAGIEISQHGLSPSGLYYAREKYFQGQLYKLSEDRIKQAANETLGLSSLGARDMECRIVTVFLHYLEEMIIQNQSVHWIMIDTNDKFKHYHDSIYAKEISPTVDRSIIIEILQLARLGFEYQSRFYPFWYTSKDRYGRSFRRFLTESIEARLIP